MVAVSAEVDRILHPPYEPFRTGTLAVDPPHTLYFEECGNPAGQSVLFVHGGPGAGCSAADRRCFASRFPGRSPRYARCGGSPRD